MSVDVSSAPAALVGAKYTGPNPRGLTLGYSSDEYQNDAWAREGIHWNRERGCYTSKCAGCGVLLDLGLEETGLEPFVGVLEGGQFWCREDCGVDDADGTPSPAATASASGTHATTKVPA